MKASKAIKGSGYSRRRIEKYGFFGSIFAERGVLMMIISLPALILTSFG